MVIAFICLLIIPSLILSAAECSQVNSDIMSDSTVGTDPLKPLRLLKEKKYAELEALLGNLQDAYKKDFTKEKIYEDTLDAFTSQNSEHEKYFNDWVSKRPDSPFSFLARAIYFLLAGDTRRGDKWASDTTEENFQGMRDYYDKAISDVKQVMLKDPNIIKSYTVLIHIARADGRFSDEFKKEQLDKALKINPYSYSVRAAYIASIEPQWGGSIEKMQAAIEEAKPFYSKNQRLKSLEGRIETNRGYQSFYYDKDKNAALDHFEKAVAYNTTNDTNCWLFQKRGDLLDSVKKEYKSAMESYDRAINACPFYLVSRIRRSALSYRFYDYEKALKDAEIVIEMDPSQSEPYFIRGRVYFKKGEYEKALEDMQKAIAIKPKSKRYQDGLQLLLEEMDKNTKKNKTEEERVKPKEDILQ